MSGSSLGPVRFMAHTGTRTPRGAVAHRGVSVCPYAECRGDGNAGLTAAGHSAVFLPRGIFFARGNRGGRGESWPRSMAGEHLATHSPWVFSRERRRNAGSRFARRPRYCQMTRSPRVLACAGIFFARFCGAREWNRLARGNRGRGAFVGAIQERSGDPRSAVGRTMARGGAFRRDSANVRFLHN